MGFLERDGSAEAVTRAYATPEEAMGQVDAIVSVLDQSAPAWEFVGTHYQRRTGSGLFTVEEVKEATADQQTPE